MPTPEQMDRDEHRRVENMRRAAKKREVIRGDEKFIPSPTRRRYINIPINTGKMMRGGSFVLGDLAMRYIKAAEKAEALRDPGVVLVKDGKLTPEGIARGIKLPDA